MKTYLIIAVSLFCFMCTCKSPTNNNDDPPSNDTIPSTMPQQHIPWPSLADSPWPMYRHDPQGTGRSQYPGPQLGQLKWKMPAPGVPSGNGFTSSAIGPDGTIYIPSSYESHEGFGQVWNFYAINPNGTIKWTWFGTIKWAWFDSLNMQISGEIERSPLITADGTIILCAKGGPESYVYAINPNGTLKWKYYVNRQPSDPNIGLDGTIYFCTVNGLYALTPDGQLKWELNTTNEFGPSPASGMSISADCQTLYVGGWYGHDILYAVSIEGEVKWSFDDGDTSHYNALGYMPMVDNQNNVYIITGQGLLSISPEGQERWRYEDTYSGEQVVMDANGLLYIYSLHKITALNYAGQELWSVDHHYFVQSGIVMDNSGVIYTIGNNEVSAVSSIDGSLIWELYLGYSYHSWYSPALGNGMLYFGIAGYDNKSFYAIQ